MVVAAPGVLAAAQTRIGLNGGQPSEWPILSSVLASQGLTQEGWLEFASHVGENWLPGTTPVALDYPGQLGLVSGPSALTADQSTAVGQRLLHALILSELAKGQPVAVAGLSEGTLVIDRELAHLATLPATEAPSKDALTFYVFGDMLRGLGQMYLPGVTIPFIGQTFGPVPESRYDTVVVNEQWDGWANPPDRPWNGLAVLNAVMGAVYTVNGSNDHSQTSLDSLSEAVQVSQTTNSQGGTTTTYMVPRKQLPLTRPLQQLGVPAWAVDEIDKLLTPLILTGYSNMTPNLGPRIERGQLVFTPPPAPAAVTPAVAATHDDVAPTPLAVNAVASRAATTVPSAAAIDEGASRDRRHDQPVAEVAGAVDEGPEPQTAQRPRAIHVRGTADPDGTVAREVPSPTDDLESRIPHRRPTHVRGPADPEGTSDVRNEAESGAADKPESAGANTSAPAASGATSE